MQKIILWFTMFIAASAHAGWTSGGGELVRDSKNPWFVKSATTVTYCVEIDEANFGQSRQRAEQLIKVAFDGWKQEFKNQVGVTGYDWRIATQDFVLVPQCVEGRTDIRFQFGTLTGEQMRELDDPTRFVGITVRTHYDKKAMRGKGFVYISPAYGPLKLDREDMTESPWTLRSGGLLYLVLLHEIGHIFGVPHVDRPYTLMGERYPEYILSAKAAPYHADYGATLPTPSIFKFHGGDFKLTLCGEGGPNLRHKLFGLKPEHECFGHSLLNNKLVISGNKFGAPPEVVGEAELQRFDGLIDVDPVMHIWLPKEQTVFPRIPGGPLAAGPLKQSLSRFKGIYRSKDGAIQREVFVLAEPGRGYQIGGVYEGKVFTDVAQEF